MTANPRGSGVESKLLDLLEYRVIHGAVITTPDGLIVANAATGVDDAEQLAATAVTHQHPDDELPHFWSIESEYGAIKILSGHDLSLIVLTETGLEEETIRPTLTNHLREIEHMIRN